MDDSRGVRGWAAELIRDGVVVLPGYLDADRCERLRTAVEDGLESVPAAETRDDGEGPVRIGDPDGPGVTELVDAHMVDDSIDELRDETVLEGIVNACTEEFSRATGLDVRVRTGPTDPRGYHAGDGPTYFAVAYLTDVADAGDGPFAYVHGSHAESNLKRAVGSMAGDLLGVGTGEAGFYDAGDGTAHAGAAGTVFVAHGRGYHRFLPVQEGRASTVAIVEFEPGVREATHPDDDGWGQDPPDDG